MDSKSSKNKTTTPNAVKKSSYGRQISPTKKYEPDSSSDEKSTATKKSAAPKTPYSFRQRLKKRIQNEIEEEETAPFDVSEESDWEESESESSSTEDNEDEPSSPILPKFAQSVTLTSAEHKSNYVYSSDYIDKSSGKSVTSSQRLKRIEDTGKISELLSSYVPSHSSHINSLRKRNKGMYYKWMYALSKGYNILVYGLGSKESLLDTFKANCLKSCRVLVINGFFSGLTLKEIISSLFELISGKSKETIEGIFSLLDQPNAPRIFIIIHNIDGMALRQDKFQLFFSQLASRENVHLVASIDHINAPLLWDQKKSRLFNFIWEDCTSFLPYTKEKCYESSLMGQSSSTVALSSLRNVYRSLNKNSKSVFKLLLEHTLNPHSKNVGMQFSELYRLCRRNFIVSSDLALRTQLTEFIDHQLVKWKKEKDVLTVCVDKDVLKIFKSEIDNNEI